MKVFTTFSIAIIIVVTLNSCSSTHNSTGRNNAKTEGYYNTSLQITPAPMHYLGIIPFGTYGGVMRIPIFYYNLGDYYRDVALNALDLYNNPSSYLLAYYSWNAYYNPYYFSSIPEWTGSCF
jgi:hypothetical protein